MLTIIETPNFQRMAIGVLNEVEREELAVFLSSQPLAGEVIPHAEGLRKVRWARSGMGKQGGARVIYFSRLAQGNLVLIAVYAKAKFDNMPVEVLKSWKEAYDG